MASTINTNVQSLNAQRNLGVSQNSLATSMQRLSSGLRINSAKDDAAGLAIAERMGTQVRGINQAARNANDGVSMAQTAEGALGTIGNNLQRIRELAVQSRNATNSDGDRSAMNSEVQQLKQEIQRVAEQTDFNGTKLLDGSFKNQAFQVGANQGQTINISQIANTNINDLGDWKSAVTPASVTGVKPAGAATPVPFAALTAGAFTITGTKADGTAGSAINIEVGTAANAGERTTALVNAINAKTHETNVTASVVNGALSLQSSKGDFTIGGAVPGDVLAETGLTAGSSGSVTGDTAFAPGTAKVGFAALDISTTGGADNAILAMDAAIKSVNSSRADLGAIQNRFSSVVDNLNTNSENISASRSRIMDADFAQETANLSRSQILQQAGTAMVAQANQLPQSVLKLLG